MKALVRGWRTVFVLAAVALLAGLVAVPASASPACDVTKCATVSGSVTRGPWNSTWGEYEWVQFHASCAHSSLLGGRGECYSDGSSGSPCSMFLSGTCNSHSHSTRYWVSPGECVVVKALTSDGVTTVGDVHMACA